MDTNDTLNQLISQAANAARDWLAEAGPQDDPLPTVRLDPLELLSDMNDDLRVLDTVAPSADECWEPVLTGWAALAIRNGRLDVLARVLRTSGRLGLADRPIIRRAAGFLAAQQHDDGGFGPPADSTDPTAVAVRVELTRTCLLALTR